MKFSLKTALKKLSFWSFLGQNFPFDFWSGPCMSNRKKLQIYKNRKPNCKEWIISDLLRSRYLDTTFQFERIVFEGDLMFCRLKLKKADRLQVVLGEVSAPEVVFVGLAKGHVGQVDGERALCSSCVHQERRSRRYPINEPEKMEYTF